MIRSLLKLAVFLVVGILVYNYFFGTAEEKEQSRNVATKVFELGKDAWGLLKSEKAKFDDGKYDDAVDRVEGLFSKLRGSAEDLKDDDALTRLTKLEQQRQELEDYLEEERPEGYDQAEQRRIEGEWKELMKGTESLMEDMEKRGELN